MLNSSIKDNKNLVYKSKTSNSDRWAIIKAALIPAGVFVLCLFVIGQFGGYGKKLLSPLIAAMWLMGTVSSIILPSHRTTIIKETTLTIALYALGMYGLRFLAGMASGISSTMLTDSLDLTMPTTYGNTILGYIQTFLTLTSVLVPMGFITMQGKRIFSLKRNGNKTKFMNQTRNIRDKNGNMQ